MNRTVSLKDHPREQSLFLSRVVAAAVVVLLLTTVLVGRLYQLQVLEYEQFADMSQGNRLRIEPLPPTRGLIFDRNGVVLAENQPTWQLVVIPEEVPDIEHTLSALEALGLVDVTERDDLIDLVTSHRGFERVNLRNLTDEQAAKFAVRRHHYPGVDIREGLVRHYPYGEAAAHALGYVARISRADLERIERSEYAATSNIGKTGIERSYENLLHGSVGYRQQVVNAQGRILLDPAVHGSVPAEDDAQTSLETRWPRPGDNLILSLDIGLQLTAEEAMQDMRGAVIAIDPATGDVLAFVSSPSFDLNRFSLGLSQADFRALNTDPDKPLFNRALSGSYPPGSVVKPFLGLAALDYGVVDPDQRAMCPGYFQLPGHSHRYRDWKPQGHGLMDLHRAIVESCDVYYYRLAVSLGIDAIDEFMRSFGFGNPTGLDIMGETRGVVPSREWKRTQFSRREDQVWFPGETVITGIGQGFTLVTPMQLAHATAALASRGQRFRPRLLAAIEDGVTGEVSMIDPVELPPIEIADDYWDRIHGAMVGVTEEVGGSARLVMRNTPYSVAGKTGTAQVFSLGQDEKYDADSIDANLRDHGLFVAFAPAEAPTIAIATIVENRGGGSATAAPIVRKVLDAYLAGGEDVDR